MARARSPGGIGLGQASGATEPRNRTRCIHGGFRRFACRSGADLHRRARAPLSERRWTAARAIMCSGGLSSASGSDLMKSIGAEHGELDPLRETTSAATPARTPRAATPATPGRRADLMGPLPTVLQLSRLSRSGKLNKTKFYIDKVAPQWGRPLKGRKDRFTVYKDPCFPRLQWCRAPSSGPGEYDAGAG